MILRCVFVLFILYSMRISGAPNVYNDLDEFSFWPSSHNVMVWLKREAAIPANPALGQSEGGSVGTGNQPALQPETKNLTLPEQIQPVIAVKPLPTVNATASNSTVSVAPPATIQKDPKLNTTVSTPPPTQLDLNNPGVLKRALIVFGGFVLLGVAYYVFFKRKGNKSDTTNTHNTNDTNQFRYGVLQSDEQRDNMELSRIPLTMESDEDEDEDLEIFDLGQKKKSLSYVNLQTNDDVDLTLPGLHSDIGEGNIEQDNLLLDIEDAADGTLINWSNNSHKSIL